MQENQNIIEMPPEPKSNKAKKTRQRILNAARKVFAEKGFNKATAEEIAQQAEVGYGTFYLYFKDKRQALHTILKEVDDRLYQPGKESFEKYRKGLGALSTIKATVRSFFDSFEENADILKICHELSATDPDFKEQHDAVRARLTNIMKSHLEKGFHAGNVKLVDSDIASHALAGMIEMIAIDRFFNHKTWDREKLVNTVSKLYFNAVIKSK